MPNLLSLFQRAFRKPVKKARRWHCDFEPLEDRLAPAGNIVAQNDIYATITNVPVSVTAAGGVLANDTDVGGRPLTAALASAPAHGTLTLNPDGSFAYQPNANYQGADSFTYQDNDGLSTSNIATVSLTIGAGSSPVPIDWVDWTAATTGLPGSAQGTVTIPAAASISVAYAGEVTFADTSGGPSYYTQGAPYVNAIVTDPPPPSDIIALDGGDTISDTVTFSQPVTNPVFAIVSLGAVNMPASYAFNAPFDILSYGPAYWAGPGLLQQAPGNVLVGTEGDGIIQFQGTFSSISWTAPTNEHWHGFTVGIPRTSIVIGGPTPTTMTMATARPTVTYGTPVTFSATVTTANTTPTGTVEFFDDTTATDLGTGILQSSGTGAATWTYATAPTQLQVTGHADAIRAVFAGTGFAGNSVQLTAGETVTPLALTVTGITANNKVYDGTTTATVNLGGAALAGVLGGDNVTLSTAGATAKFGSKDAANNVPVVVTGLTLGGAQAGDYTLGGSTGVPPAGVVAYWRFEEGSANTPATAANSILDSSANGLNGTPISGPVYRADVGATPIAQTGATNNLSLDFNGTNQRVTIPDNPLFQLTHSVTLEAYVKLRVNTGGEEQIVFRGDDRPSNDPYLLEIRGGALTLRIEDATNDIALTYPFAPYVGQWVHVAGSIDDSTGKMSLYINGALVASSTTATRPLGALTGANPGLGIGNVESASYSEYFNGLIDEVRISSQALEPAQLLGGPPAGVTIMANIAPAPLTVTGITANNKVYDGTATATLNTVNAALAGVISGDSVTLNTAGAAGTFDTKDVGNGKTVMVSGLTLAGAQTIDYTLTQPTTTADITLAPSPVAVNDAYTVTMNKTLTVSAPAGVTSLTMQSQPGDYLGGGQNYSYSLANGTFTVTHSGNHVSIDYSDSHQSGVWWDLDFASPANTALVPGVYLNAARYPFQSAGQPGLSVFGESRGSNTLTGQFTIMQDVYDAAGHLLNFDATWVLHNEGLAPTLSGEVKYNYIAPAGVLSNDTDPGGVPLTAILVSGPSHGTLTLNPDGTFTYQPNANFSGADSFTYKANDGILDSNVATVSLNVLAANSAPTAQNHSYAFSDDVPFSVAAPGVLAGAADVDGDSLTAVLVSPPIHGTVGLNPNGSFVYTPVQGFYGTDTFTYAASDGTSSSNPATVSLTITQVDHPPVAVNDGYTLAANQTLTVAPLAGVTSLTMQSQAGDYIGAGQNYSYAPPATTFTLSRNFDNGVSANVAGWGLSFAGPGKAALVPGKYLNAERFPFQASLEPGLDISGQGRGSNTLTGAFTVKQASYDAGGNVLVFDAIFVQHSEGAAPALTGELKYNAIPLSGVLSNDSDPDSDLLTAILVSGPAHGTLTLNADGTFTYAPNTGFNGTDTFTYKANDGILDSNVATVSLAVGTPTTTPTTMTVTTARPTVTYGTPVTFSATVATAAGSPAGTVELFDDTTGADLGAGISQSSGAGTATWTLTTMPTQLQVTAGPHAIRAVFTGQASFLGSAGTLTGGETVTPAPLTVMGITAHDKIYDATRAATLDLSGATLAGVMAGDLVNFVGSSGTNSVSITSLSTGYDRHAQSLVAPFTLDPNYQITGPGGQTYYAQARNAAGLSPAYFGDSALPGSLWDYLVNTPTSTSNDNVPSGNYVLTTTANLTGYDPRTVQIANLLVGADNAFLSVAVNGTTVFSYDPGATAEDFHSPLYFGNVGLGSFQPGSNTIQFTFMNTGFGFSTGPSPAAIRIQADLEGLVSGLPTGTFDTKDVGTGKTVTVSGLTLQGPQAADYALTQPTTTANVTPAPLTVSGVTATDKVYDGTTIAPLNVSGPTLNGVLPGDTVTVSTSAATGTFASKAVRINIAVAITGVSLGGAQAADYTLLPVGAGLADITPDLVNNPLAVTVGTGAPINANFLKADRVSDPASVVFTLLSAPTGILQDGFVTLAAGSTFTQADISSGQLVYRGNSVGSDSFQFSATDGQGGTVPASTFQIAITPVLPVALIGDISRLEGTGGLTPFVFHVSLGSVPLAAVTYDLFTTDGSAVSVGANPNFMPIIAGVNNSYGNPRITFARGQVRQTFTVYIIAGSIAASSAPKSFTVSMSSQGSPNVAIASATGTIVPQAGTHPALAAIVKRAAPAAISADVALIAIAPPTPIVSAPVMPLDPPNSAPQPSLAGLDSANNPTGPSTAALDMVFAEPWSASSAGNSEDPDQIFALSAVPPITA